MSNTTIVLHPSFRNHQLVAALHMALCPQETLIPIEIDLAANASTITEAILSKCSSPAMIISYGTFWSACKEELQTRFPATFFLEYQNTETKNDQRIGLAKFVVDLTNESGIDPSQRQSILTRCKKLIMLSEDCHFNRNVFDTQRFFVGLTVAYRNTTMIDATKQFIGSDLKIEQVQLLGHDLVATQCNLLALRLKNVVEKKLTNGATALMVNADVMVDLTHALMKERMPTADFTILFRDTFLDDGTHQRAWSVRCYSAEYSAIELLLQKLTIDQCGGDAISAGGQGTNFDLSF